MRDIVVSLFVFSHIILYCRYLTRRVASIRLGQYSRELRKWPVDQFSIVVLHAFHRTTNAEVHIVHIANVSQLGWLSVHGWDGKQIMMYTSQISCWWNPTFKLQTSNIDPMSQRGNLAKKSIEYYLHVFVLIQKYSYRPSKSPIVWTPACVVSVWVCKHCGNPQARYSLVWNMMWYHQSPTAF